MHQKDPGILEKTSMENARIQFRELLMLIFSRENLLALAIALLLIAIYITSATDAPLWVYQGF